MQLHALLIHFIPISPSGVTVGCISRPTPRALKLFGHRHTRRWAVCAHNGSSNSARWIKPILTSVHVALTLAA